MYFYRIIFFFLVFVFSEKTVISTYKAENSLYLEVLENKFRNAERDIQKQIATNSNSSLISIAPVIEGPQRYIAPLQDINDSISLEASLKEIQFEYDATAKHKQFLADGADKIEELCEAMRNLSLEESEKNFPIPYSSNFSVGPTYSSSSSCGTYEEKPYSYSYSSSSRKISSSYSFSSITYVRGYFKKNGTYVSGHTRRYRK